MDGFAGSYLFDIESVDHHLTRQFSLTLYQSNRASLKKICLAMLGLRGGWMGGLGNPSGPTTN